MRRDRPWPATKPPMDRAETALLTGTGWQAQETIVVIGESNGDPSWTFEAETNTDDEGLFEYPLELPETGGVQLHRHRPGPGDRRCDHRPGW